MENTEENGVEVERDLYAEWKRKENELPRLTALCVVLALGFAAWYYTANVLLFIAAVALVVAYIAISFRFRSSRFSFFEDFRQRSRVMLENKMIHNLIAAGVIDEDTSADQVLITAICADPPTFEMTFTQQGRTEKYIQDSLQKFVPVFDADRMTFQKIGNTSFSVSYPPFGVYDADRVFSWSEYGR